MKYLKKFENYSNRQNGIIMKNFNNFINEKNINSLAFEWKNIINEIGEIMEVLINIKCEIKCPLLTIYELIYKPDNNGVFNFEIYVGYKYDDGTTDVSRITKLVDVYLENIHEYLIKNYNYVLSGKDMGLL